MRLIDEEKLMEDIQKTITEQSGTIDWLNMIYRLPIAYNVDNVVDQLEEIVAKLRSMSPLYEDYAKKHLS